MYFPDQTEVRRHNSSSLTFRACIGTQGPFTPLNSAFLPSVKLVSLHVCEWNRCWGGHMITYWLIIGCFALWLHLLLPGGYSGGSFIRLQFTCCPDSATVEFCFVDWGIQLEHRPRHVSKLYSDGWWNIV